MVDQRPTGTFDLEDVSVAYGKETALAGVTMHIPTQAVTALIGPSGCGKSTLLRCLNRMNDELGDVTVGGRVLLDGVDINARDVDPVELRMRVGMVFQRPNPFPMSIYDNVVYGPRTHGIRKRAELDCLVEESLTRAALWDEVKGSLKKHAFELSGGQQQRLCIARALATRPEVLLMDEPASALDPISTQQIEDTIAELKRVGHDRHRHAQHAAGRAHLRPDRVHAARVDGDARAPHRGRRDQVDVHDTRTTSAPRPTSPAGSADRTSPAARTMRREQRRPPRDSLAGVAFFRATRGGSNLPEQQNAPEGGWARSVILEGRSPSEGGGVDGSPCSCGTNSNVRASFLAVSPRFRRFSERAFVRPLGRGYHSNGERTEGRDGGGMRDLTIRPAAASDASSIAAIYNHYVRTSTATFDTEERSVAAQIAWLGEHEDAHPVLVAENDEQGVVAWGALSPFRSRVRMAAHGRDIGLRRPGRRGPGHRAGAQRSTDRQGA